MVYACRAKAMPENKLFFDANLMPEKLFRKIKFLARYMHKSVLE